MVYAARMRTFPALPLAFVLLLAGCPRAKNSNADLGSRCSPNCVTCDGQGACHDCTAGQNLCLADTVLSCNPDGTVGPLVKTCDSANNEKCSNGNCLSPCDIAGATHSYIGCDYWPVTLLTAQLNPSFDFAVAVANPAMQGDVVMGAPATVKVYSGKALIATKVVPAGGVEVIRLPWQSDLSQNFQHEVSVLSPEGAYHLVSSLPVTVYQFSPLEFEKPQSKACTDNPDVVMNGMCHSFTNDASILLPSTALRSDYYVIARQTYGLTRADPQTGAMTSSATPGFLAVVATQDKTTVTLTSSSYTEGGINISPLSPGGKDTYSLDAGDVIEIVSKKATSPCAGKMSDAEGSYCDLGPSYDLTGSHVTADKPIAVFGGHSCSFVPYNKFACDHLEQQMTPIETWGKKIVVVQTNPQTAGEPNYWRIISATDGNQITFDPPTTHKAATLDAGHYFEFVSEGGFQVSGTGHVAVGQYMVGASYLDPFGSVNGDPSLGLGVPVEQHRKDYDFYSPSTYTKNYLTAIAPMGAKLVLDGNPVMDAFTPIGGSGYGYQYIELIAGGHHMTGDQKFGITVSGIARFTSYLYVGGQNLDEVPLQ